MSELIRLLIVDDHPVVRDGLSGMFSGDPDFDVVGEAANGTEAVARATTLRPDVIYAKLGVNDRAAAVAAGFDRGLLTPGGRD